MRALIDMLCDADFRSAMERAEVARWLPGADTATVGEAADWYEGESYADGD